MLRKIEINTVIFSQTWK